MALRTRPLLPVRDCHRIMAFVRSFRRIRQGYDTTCLAFVNQDRRHLLRFSVADFRRIARETIIELFPLVAVKHTIARPPGTQGIVLHKGHIGIASVAPAKCAAQSDRSAVAEPAQRNVRPVAHYLISFDRALNHRRIKLSAG